MSFKGHGGVDGAMRNGFRFAGVALALLAGQSGMALAAMDDTHSYSLINASDSRVDFADQNAHMAQGGFVTFTILTVLPAGNVAYSLSQVSINCGKAQLATLE